MEEEKNKSCITIKITDNNGCGCLLVILALVSAAVMVCAVH